MLQVENYKEKKNSILNFKKIMKVNYRELLLLLLKSDMENNLDLFYKFIEDEKILINFDFYEDMDLIRDLFSYDKEKFRHKLFNNPIIGSNVENKKIFLDCVAYEDYSALYLLTGKDLQNVKEYKNMSIPRFDNSYNGFFVSFLRNNKIENVNIVLDLFKNNLRFYLDTLNLSQLINFNIDDFGLNFSKYYIMSEIIKFRIENSNVNKDFAIYDMERFLKSLEERIKLDYNNIEINKLFVEIKDLFLSLLNKKNYVKLFL